MSPVRGAKGVQLSRPEPPADCLIEAIATALCHRRGFGFYTDPTEGGQDAFDISSDALEDARLIYEIILKPLLTPQTDRVAEVEKQWRCFHCGEVFTDHDSARAHFGSDEIPACCLNAKEGGIAAKLRQVEHELDRYRSEDSDVDRQFYAMRADHAVAVRRAEEDGYGKGVRDMNAQLAAAEKQCEELRRALEQIRDGYLGDQTAEAQFIWAQDIAHRALASTSPKEGT